MRRLIEGVQRCMRHNSRVMDIAVNWTIVV